MKAEIIDEDVKEDLHRMLVQVESGKKKWFNFQHEQVHSGRYKKHIRQWLEKMQTTTQTADSRKGETFEA